jgi:hypothetical protein
MIRIQIKVTSQHHIIKAYEEEQVHLHFFFTSELHEYEWSASWKRERGPTSHWVQDAVGIVISTVCAE